MDDAVRDHPTNMPELVEAMDAAWGRLNATLDGVDEAEATTVADANGWTARDHVIHLAAWERSTLALLQRRPRHEALGISEASLHADDVDANNEAIRAANADKGWGAVRMELSDVHSALMSTLNTLTWDDMELPYSNYLPDKPGEEGAWPVGIWVYSNGSLHFDEHRQWIEELLAADR